MFIVPARARRVTALALCGLLSMSGCSKADSKSAATAAGVAAPGAAAAPASAASPIDLVPLPPDTAADELKLYRLSMDRLKRWAQAQVAMNTLTAQHPEIMDSMKLAGPPKTLDQMIKILGSEPRFRPVFKDARINAHDFVITMFAMQQAMEGVQHVASGKQLPPDLPPALGANITFVQQNMPTIQQLLRPMQK